MNQREACLKKALARLNLCTYESSIIGGGGDGAIIDTRCDDSTLCILDDDDDDCGGGGGEEVVVEAEDAGRVEEEAIGSVKAMSVSSKG